MPATPKPVFISPLAAPLCCGAMSIGIVHSGELHSSRKKKARVRQIVTPILPCRNATGARHTAEPPRPTIRPVLRERARFDVRRRSRSHSAPPYQSPTTPPSSVNVVNRADSVSPSPNWSAKNDGIQVR